MKNCATKNSVFKYLILCLCFVCFATTLIACSKTEEEKSASLRLKWIAYIGWAGEYAALDLGLWEKNGLNVDVRPGGFEQDPVRLVPAGADDFGVLGADSLLQAREKGIPLVAIGLQYQTSPAGFMVKTSSGIKTPKDFEGRNVGVTPGSDKDTVYKALVASANIDKTKINEIPVKADLTPFFEDQVDVFPVFMTNQPIQAREKGFDVTVIDPRDYGIQYMGNVYVTTEDKIKNNKAEVLSFLKGTIEGWEWALSAQEDEVAKMILKYNSELEQSGQKKVLSVTKPFIKSGNTPIGWMTPGQWEGLAKILKNQGIIKSEDVVNGAYTMEFLNEIYDQK